ncbi:MAG: DNA polymerase III subunit gamma/tau [Chitinophagaceae bacterium]
MEKFIVSARKYRPQNFSTVVGQQHITTTLKNAIRNKQLAHAFLFCGPRGVGKTTCARILAKTINCEHPGEDGEACNTCHSCVSFNDGASLNIHELDAASNNSVDDIRTLVEQVRFAPQAGEYKVYIIDEVHMLSSSAFNAFLKTLEEPPPYAIFILATTEKHKILPTILSRCQIFDFKRITTQDTADHLNEICEKESVKAEMAALQLIAQKSEGCMRDALSIMDKIVSFTNGELSYTNTLEHLNILDADYYFRLMDAMLKQDVSSALLMFDEINRKGFEGDTVLNGLAEFIRNLLVCKDPKVASLLDVVESFKDRYVTMAGAVSASLLVSALNLLSDAEIQYRGARNKRLHIELTLIKLCYLQQAIELTDGGSGPDKKKITDRPLAFRTVSLMPAPASEKKAVSGAKLIVETAATAPKNNAVPSRQSAVETPTAIAQPPAYQQQPAASKSGQATTTVSNQPTTVAPLSPSTGGGLKLGSLSKLRQEIAARNSGPAEKKERIPLTPELLKEHWQGFADKLREAKNPAVQSFELSELRVLDEENFEVVTGDNIMARFIDAEKRELAEYLQEKFCNNRLLFTVVIEQREDLGLKFERPLTPREIFMQMAEQYPLINDLRIRLRLEVE